MTRASKRWAKAAVIVAVGFLIISPFTTDSGYSQSSQWQIVDKTPRQGGVGQAIVGLPDSLFIVRETGGRLDIWRMKQTGSMGFQIQSPGPIKPSASFKNGTALAWDGNRYVYALFGRATSSNNARNVFMRYDTCMGTSSDCSEAWESLPDTPQSQGAGDALTFIREDDEGFVYAFTGNQNFPGDFARYNVNTNNWTGGLSFPARWVCVDDGASLAWSGEHIYALHGSDCSDTATTDFARYDRQSQTWDTMPPIPTAVDDGGSLIWDGNDSLYAISGGGNLSNNEKEDLSGKDFFRFDLQNLQWERLSDLPCAVGFYTGNRLAFLNGAVHAWQGAPSTWGCNGAAGDALMRFIP